MVINSLNTLDGKLFKAYMSKKIEPIEEILEEALDVDSFDYERNSIVKGTMNLLATTYNF